MGDVNKNYSIQGQILKDIADAIRDKTSTTSEINTLNMSTMIESISGGGGGLPTGWVYSTTTLTADNEALTYTHNHGSIPIIAIAIASNPSACTIKYAQLMRMAILMNDSSSNYIGCHLYNSYQGVTSAITNSNMGAFTADETTVSFGSRGGSYIWKADVEYTILLIFEN